MTTRPHPAPRGQRPLGLSLVALVGLAGLGLLALACGGSGGTADGGTCPPGQELCAGICTNTTLDPSHCGSCSRSCATGEACVGGACGVVCPPGQTNCGGACTNTAYDAAHCGDCATACTGGQVCVAGSCAAGCPPGLTECDGACTDTRFDPQHCGNCVTACNNGESCATGTCLLLCPPGQTNCGGTCTNTRIDPQHCGNCTTACASGEVCVAGDCASFCPAGTSWCGAGCADLQRDAANCGACDHGCGGLGCTAGRCSAPRGGGILDSWGELWDSFQRPAAAWADAAAACLADGGRLPTVTELFRVNATSGTGELSDTSAAAALWSQVPWSGTAYTAVRLSDGIVYSPTATTLVAYRCVWPDATDDAFGANSCYGPPGDACRPAAGTPDAHVDAWERPPVSYLAATFECASLHAHLPQQFELAQAVTGTPALAGGSNNYLWTADVSRYDLSQLVRWTGTEAATYTDVAPYVSWAARTGTYRFRCLGPDHDLGPHPATVANEFVAATTQLKSETTDRTAATLAEAASTCFAAGGHLPTVRDLVELVAAGLPAGPGVPLWTADSASYRYTEVLTWTGIQSTFAALSPAEAGWSDRAATTTHLYRCVYYPVDATVTAPAGCNGGCFTVTQGPVTVWADTFDRVPATYLEALNGCVAVGGHLASPRDFLELVRAGLPNGSNTYLWTSDAAGGEYSTGNPDAQQTVRWTDVAVSFDLTTPTYVSQALRGAAQSAPFRCVFTNEYR